MGKLFWIGRDRSKKYLLECNKVRKARNQHLQKAWDLFGYVWALNLLKDICTMLTFTYTLAVGTLNTT